MLKVYQRYHNNPLLYCKEILGVGQVWKLQEDLLKACCVAIKEHRAIYLASGHSLGKDYITAAISLWFLQCHIPSIVIQTAPTDRQTKRIMWGETLRHWNNRRIDLGGRAFVEPYLEIDKADWYLLGFTTKETGATKEGGGGKFQGFHSPSICVIVTEAQAIEDNIYDQIDAITSSENCLVIYIGNPTRAKGRFAAGLKDKQRNIVFNFSCLENPNYIEKRTVIPGLASYEWVEAMRKKWGESDPRWIGRVLGQIPDVAINNIFPMSLIEHMKARHGLLARYGNNAGVAVDPAGEGVDDNVFMAGNDGEILEVYTKTLMSPSNSAIKAVDMCKSINGHFIVVDCDGVGIGVYQELNGLDESYLEGINIIKFHGSAPSEVREGDRRIYANMRSEAAFVAKDRGQAGRAAIDQQDYELIEDLMEDEYFENKRGQLQIIPKDEIKERLGRSPGRGDTWKMLQWAFNQEYSNMVYKYKSRHPLDRYYLPKENGNDQNLGICNY